MSDFTMLVASNSTGPVTGGGTGSGYYDGSNNGGTTCGSITAGSPPKIFGSGAAVNCCGWASNNPFLAGGQFLVIATGTLSQEALFDFVQIVHPSPHVVLTYYTNMVNYFSTTALPGFTVWAWTDSNESTFIGQNIQVTFDPTPTPPSPTGEGDITDPLSWEDENGKTPPYEYQNMPSNVNFPQNGDGRYWFTVDANATTQGPIKFIGDPKAFIDIAALQWSVTQAASDGSALNLEYSTDGISYTVVAIPPSTQLGSLQNGMQQVPIESATNLYVKVVATGGSANASATPWQVALAITRNVNEQITWDGPNPFNPIFYNGQITDNVVPTDSLSDLRYRLMVRLGFANQANFPPPGMAALMNDFLISSQRFLYKRYLQLHTKRKFRWKVNPGQRFYSLQDSDQDTLWTNDQGVPLKNPTIDIFKRIEWAGIQDSRNVWYPLIQGIPPQLYTMITKPWRPARYELRNCIELYPMPDQTYFLWMSAHFGLMPFAADADLTTIDSELVFLNALANAKAHYGQPDANNIAAEAQAYRLELIASTHQTAHYIPGTIAVPPAVRPTLIQFDNNLTSG